MSEDQKVAGVSVEMSLDHARFRAGCRDAEAAMKQFAAQTREEMAKSRESVKLLSEELGLGIPRGLQGIISKLPGVTTAMNAAFDAVVVFALAKTIYEVTEKIVEFAHKTEEAAAKHREMFDNLTISMEHTNDSLRVQSDNLQRSIDKIEHKPHNGIKDAIDEAIEESDKLGEKLDANIKQIEAGLAGEAPGKIDWLIGLGTTYQTGPKEVLDKLKKNMEEIELGKSLIPGSDKDAQRRNALYVAKSEAEGNSSKLTDPTNPISLALRGDAKAKELGEYQTIAAGASESMDTVDWMKKIAAQASRLHTDEDNKALKADMTEAQKKAAEEGAKAQEEVLLANKRKYDSQLPAGHTADQIFANPKLFEQDESAKKQYLAGGAKDQQNYATSGQFLTDTLKQLGLNDPSKSFTNSTVFAELFKRLVLTVLPALSAAVIAGTAAGKEDLNSQAAKQGVISLAYDGQVNKEGAEAQKSSDEAMRSLTAAVNKASETYLLAISKQREDEDKALLKRGRITESQYEANRKSDIGVEVKTRIKDAQTKYDATVAGLLDSLERDKDQFNNTKGVGLQNALTPGWKGASAADVEAVYQDQLKGLNASMVKGEAGAKNIQNFEVGTAKANAAMGIGDATFAAKQSKAIGGIDAIFDEIAQRSTDVGKQIHELGIQAVNDLNAAILHIMTTREEAGVHPFKQAGKSIFDSVAKTGLQDGEGYLKQLITGKGGHKPTGQKGDEVNIIDRTPGRDGSIGGGAGGPGSSFASGGLAGAALNWANNSDFMGGLFGGKVFGPGGVLFNAGGGGGSGDGSGTSKNGIKESDDPAKWNAGIQDGIKIAGLAYGASQQKGTENYSPSGGADTSWDELSTPVASNAGGGVVSPGDWSMVGEAGPELAHFGSGARIYNNRDTTAMMNGGGTTHNHSWNVDARGATDPAAINAAVQRGIRQAAPHLVKASATAQHDRTRRTPSGRG